MPSLDSLNSGRWILSSDGRGRRVSNTDSPIGIIEVLETQLRQGSIKAAVQLAAQLEFNLNKEHECEKCFKIASYFLFAFQTLKRNTRTIILCNSTLLALVQQSIELIQAHSNYSSNTVFSALLTELRDLGKQIKDQSVLPDKYVPLPLPSTFQLEQQPITFNDQTNQIQEDFGRAIRITIYHFRASLYENLDINQSIYYYRKCVSILPSQFDYNQRNLQQSALLSLQHYQPIICSNSNTNSRRTSIMLSSRTSSTVSFSTSSGTSISSSSCTSMTCANCGTEKQRMPICSRCKSQSYCSIQCLKIHKIIHATECSPL